MLPDIHFFLLMVKPSAEQFHTIGVACPNPPSQVNPGIAEDN
jgi:hypothetical protein